ncbi:hypothetical protein CTAYLR_009021 [Chrysophaeum taylorii]|uniref:Uncharacterized protein n=1 Tax=Chrysophaeum taylorii TaxID=2483200 RepID=A0AAD7XKT3_9STRA|nr:hypothetical protein CTAYLR_009021 [Chrysophaeum taylorii]
MDHEELKRNNQKAAARRFRYLLRQSGMLDFFRGGLFEIGDEAAADLAPATKQARCFFVVLTQTKPHQESRRSGRTSPSSKEEEEEDVAPDYLTHQPSCVVGGTMRSYQLEGLNWMIRLRNNGLNGILADEMGLGKTLQSISMLAYLHEYKNVSGPHLVLVPKTTLSNWLNEFSRWLPALRVVKFHGTKEERALTVSTILEGVTTKKKQQRERSWDVIVTTYEVANLEKTTLSRLAWRFLVVDEAHRIKNENAQLSKTVRMLKVENRLLITGTPLQNNLHELWALLNFLLPDIFASAERFDELFDLQIVDADAKKAIIAQLHKLLRPFVLRRLKHDVETSLPPKSETILFCSMSDAQREVYRHCLLREIDVVQAGGQRTAVLNLAMQLRKCCNHPYLFPNVEDRSLPPLGEHLVTNCGKLHLLDKLMSRLRARDHRVLVFSQMTRMLDILEDYVVMRRYEYCRIDGKTPHDLREAQIDAYNAPGSTKFIFLLSTRAGGLGVNLQTADTCVLYDSDWNPQADLQAMDRCHRIGQTKPVHVYRLVTEHSIEEKVVERAQQKLKLDAMVVQQGRLQDKERKIATETLLSAVRFGADKVFRPEKEVTDDDMDAIIARGQKRTAELEARLASADKGDMLDFKLDGGMDTQQWEGVDYSDLAIRQQLKNADDPSQTPFVLDTGKRERKKTSQTIYEERTAPASSSKKHHKDDNKSGGGADKDDAASSSGGGAGGSGKKDDSKGDGPPSKKKKKDKTNSSNNDDDDAPAAANGRAHAKDDPYHKPLKLPPHLRLPKLEEWQLFEHKDRLLALQAKEDEKMHELQSNHDKKLELLRDPWKYHSLQLLTDAEFAEKRRLFAQGFPRWSKHYYQAFVKASARHGREAYEKISEDLFKFTPQDVEAYATAFWTNGQKFLSSAEWDRVCRAVEKGERKLEEMEQLMKTTVRFVDLFKPNPRRNLVFRFTNTSAGIPQFPGLPSRPDEEAILLSLLVEHGYGNWRTIRSHYQRAPELSFDWFLRSLDCDAVQKRAEALMRAAEKELAELERRHQAYLAAEQAIAAARAGVPKNPKTGRPYSQPERASSPAFDDATLSAAGPPPKKPRSALRCFMRHHVRELRNQNPQSTESQLRATLTEMWERASPAERTEMDRRSELDKIRYEREQAEFMARISTMPLPPSARHSLV